MEQEFELQRDKHEFRDILFAFLKENGLTQTKFAEMIGVKQSQVSEWLKGKAKPGYDVLKQMSKAFDIPADFWLGLTDIY
ncbi:MAG: helix-turn-helix transcriptional regulator [Clostridia bacterium]|nr:helix-turn-helix transcriptional regulator [Clostridia bacterium]